MAKTSEILTYVQLFMQLPDAFRRNSVKVYKCFEKLVTHVQALETMGNYNK